MRTKWLKTPWFLFVLLLGLGIWFSQPRKEIYHVLTNPRYGPFRIKVTTTGSLRAKKSTNILGPTHAQQVRIFQIEIQDLIPEGTLVKKGDFVAQLDKSELATKIEEAKSSLAQLESEFLETKLDTALTLSKTRGQLLQLQSKVELAQTVKNESVYEARSVIRQAEMDMLETERAYVLEQKNYQIQVQHAIMRVQRVYSKLELARQFYKKIISLENEFTIFAPADGMIIYKRDEFGQTLTTGSLLNSWDPIIATLPDFSVMESVTYVNEVDIEKIKIGQAVDVQLDAQNGKTFTGQVTEIANIGQQTDNRKYTVFAVTVEIIESDSALRPALTTSNTIVIADLEEVLSVPLECVFTFGSINFVHKKEGNSIQKKEVLLGLMNTNEVIIKDGITQDDQIYMSTPPQSDESPITRLRSNQRILRR